MVQLASLATILENHHYWRRVLVTPICNQKLKLMFWLNALALIIARMTAEH